MKQEISAGAVICKQTRASWDVLLIRDMKGMLTFPKGFMEEGEDVKQTAMREAAEETGITDIIYQANLPEVSYFYTRNGQSIRKVVHYVLFFSENEHTLIPQIEEGITEILWIPIEKAIEVIGYEKSNTPVLIAAHTYLKQMKESTRL